ncbi:MAG: AAA family ATPase [Bacteroidales bacterium]|nr:AAA family ATPase [Candidatus Latescibacterota bacterium]
MTDEFRSQLRWAWCRKRKTPPETVNVPVDTYTIPYNPGDPRKFEEYLGQNHLKRRLQLRINGAKKGESIKALFSASAGQGKTALARVVAHEMQKRGLAENYFEIIASKVETKEQLDAFLITIPAHSIVFIDEIHGLQGLSRDALLPALQDNVYAYNEGSNTMTPLPEGLSWLAATTDVGKVHLAVQRRFAVYDLTPMEFEHRKMLSLMQPFSVTEDAAAELALRCWTPWEIKDEGLVVARDIATEQHTADVEVDQVIEAMDILGIDKFGMRELDRRVLTAMHNNPRIIRKELRYGMSARALIAATGVDGPTFYDRVEPKLLKLGYIRIAAGIGRELTERAMKDYFKEQ